MSENLAQHPTTAILNLGKSSSGEDLFDRYTLEPDGKITSQVITQKEGVVTLGHKATVSKEQLDKVAIDWANKTVAVKNPVS